MCAEAIFEPKFANKPEAYQLYEIEGEDVNRYIEWFLSECSDLSKAILKMRDFRTAKKYTCWLNATEKFTYSLLNGGTGESTIIVLTDWGLAKIFDYLVLNQDGVAVFEDIMFKPDSKEILEPGVPLVKMGDHVFYWIDHERCTLKAIKNAYDSAGSGFRENAILTHFDRKLEGDLDKLSDKDIELLAKNAKQLIIEAYDNTGWIQVCF